jgi:hypothetical protein
MGSGRAHEFRYAEAWQREPYSTVSFASMLLRVALEKSPRHAPSGQAAAAASMMSATGPGFDT